MKFFIELANRRRLVFALAIGAALIGLMAWGSMPREEDPQLSYRAGFVKVYFPGADVEKVEHLVVEPLERYLSQVDEIEKIDVTARSGVAVFTLRLWDSITDVVPAWDEVRRAMEKAEPEFPEGVQKPILDDKMMDYESVVLALSGPVTPLELRQAALDLEKELLRLSTVSRVLRVADPGEQITIAYDSSTARRLGIDERTLRNSLSARNVSAPAGSLVVGDKTAILRPQVEFESVDEIKNTPIPLESGASVPLSSLAEIRRGPSEPVSERMRYNGHDCIGLGVVPVSPTNAILFGKQVRQVLDRMRGRITPIKIEEVSFQPHFVKDRLQGLANSLLMSILIVAGFLMLTMGARIGLIVSAVLPIIVLDALAIYALCGGVLQQMSIAAFIIALGMLVDNAIVVAESMQVHISEGIPPDIASRNVVKELSVPLAAATGTTIAAFLPMWAATSQAADFIRAIPQVVSLTLVISYLAAMLLTPSMCSMLLKAEGGKNGSGKTGGWRKSLSDWIGGMATGHAASIVVLAVMIVLSVAMTGRFVHHSFFPKADRNTVIVDLTLPEGRHLDGIDKASRSLERALSHRDDVLAVASFMGRSAPRFYNNILPKPRSPHLAQLVVTTKSPASNLDVMDFARHFTNRELPAVENLAYELETGTPVAAPVEIRLLGASLPDLHRSAEMVLREMRHVNGLIDERHTMGLGVPSLVFDVQDAPASQLRLARRDVAQILLGRTRGLPVGQYRAEDEPVPIVVRSKEGEHFKVSDLATVDLSNTDGNTVPMGELAPMHVEWRPAAIQRHNRQRCISVQAHLEEGVSFGDAMKALGPKLKTLNFPAGVTYEIGGQAEGAGKAEKSMALATPFGAVVLIAILLASFGSFRKVFIVLLTLPLAVVGIIPGLLVSGQPFGFMSLLGVIALAGVVVNNAIVLLDVVQSRLKEGLGVDDALKRAINERLRPILLTTGTTVLGLLPLALSSSKLWPPLAWAMISGLMASTMLTLFVVPATFRLLFRDRQEPDKKNSENLI